MSQLAISRLQKKFPDAIVSTHSEHGNDTISIKKEALLEIAQFIKDDHEFLFDMPIDCTCVDWLGKREPRFELVYHFYSTAKKQRLRLKIDLSEVDCSSHSLTNLWPGFDWHERETWDMYGVRFIGHPNLRRVLMYEEFVGHPLRKDYPMDARQPLIPMRSVTQFPTQRHPPVEMLNKP